MAFRMHGGRIWIGSEFFRKDFERMGKEILWQALSKLAESRLEAGKELEASCRVKEPSEQVARLSSDSKLDLQVEDRLEITAIEGTPDGLLVRFARLNR